MRKTADTATVGEQDSIAATAVSGTHGSTSPTIASKMTLTITTMTSRLHDIQRRARDPRIDS
jgi:hypothetical protein